MSASPSQRNLWRIRIHINRVKLNSRLSEKSSYFKVSRRKMKSVLHGFSILGSGALSDLTAFQTAQLAEHEHCPTRIHLGTLKIQSKVTA